MLYTLLHEIRTSLNSCEKSQKSHELSAYKFSGYELSAYEFLIPADI